MSKKLPEKKISRGDDRAKWLATSWSMLQEPGRDYREYDRSGDPCKGSEAANSQTRSPL